MTLLFTTGMRTKTLGAAFTLIYAAAFVLASHADARTNDAVKKIVQKANSFPRTAAGKPDFSGIWQTLSTADWNIEPHHARKDAPAGLGIVVGGTIPYKPEALARRKE